MKKHDKSRESIVDRSVDTSQSVIGLYEMLAQAQPVLSHEIDRFVDVDNFDLKASTISDE